jgi:hypothetical protein
MDTTKTTITEMITTTAEMNALINTIEMSKDGITITIEMSMDWMTIIIEMRALLIKITKTTTSGMTTNTIKMKLPPIVEIIIREPHHLPTTEDRFDMKRTMDTALHHHLAQEIHLLVILIMTIEIGFSLIKRPIFVSGKKNLHYMFCK